LGPDPPLGENIKFIEFIGFLPFLGLQYSRKNRHQSRHLRPTPPREEPKSGKNGKLSKFMVFIDHYSWLRQIVRESILTPYHFLKNIDYEQLGRDKLKHNTKTIPNGH
jgi:hypothetical protein